jgi:tetratricopeptide (TPR) repeat protein
MQSGDFDSARDPLRVGLHVDLRQVPAPEQLEVQDDLVEALCGLGAALEQPGPEQHLVEAFATYHEAVTIRPDCLRALLKAGDLALRLGMPQQAVQYFDAALAVDPELGRTWD